MVGLECIAQAELGVTAPAALGEAGVQLDGGMMDATCAGVLVVLQSPAARRLSAALAMGDLVAFRALLAETRSSDDKETLEDGSETSLLLLGVTG